MRREGAGHTVAAMVPNMSHARRGVRRRGNGGRHPLHPRPATAAPRDDLAVIARLLAGASSVTVVSGEPGLGKTALLDSLRAAAAGHGVTVRVAQGVDREEPLAVVRDLVADVADPRGAVMRLAGSGPLLLLVDDAQCADPASLRELVNVAHRVGAAPVALVVAHRLDLDPARADLLDRLASVNGAQNVALAPLDDAAAAAVVRAEVPDADDELCARCRLATAGVPLLLVEVARVVAEHGPGVLGEDGRLLSDVPLAAARSVRARLAAVGPVARATAEAVSILGQGSAPLVATVAGLEPLQVARARDQLTAAALLADSRELRFACPLAAQAVAGGLGRGDRSLLHRRAAAVLLDHDAELGQVAGHLMSCEPAADDTVATVLRDAAREAIAGGAPATAAAYLQRALDEPAPAPLRPALLGELARAEFTAGVEGAAGRLRQALARLETPAERIEILTRLATIDMLQQGGTADLESALAEAAAAPDPERRRAAELAALDALLMDPARQAERRARVAALELPTGPTSDLDRATLAHMAWLAAERGDRPHSTAIELADRALADDGLIRIGLERPAFHLAVRALIVSDRLGDAEHHLQRMAVATDQAGSPWLSASVAQYLAEVHLRAGRLEEAEAAARRALAAAEPGHIVHGCAAEVLVNTLVEQQRLDEAAAVLHDLGRDGQLAQGDIGLLLARARLRLATGDPQAALADALDCGRLRAGQRRPNPAWTPWRSVAASAHIALGDSAAAAALAAEELTLARAYGAPRAIGIAAHMCALAEPDGGARLELAGSAVAALAESEARLEHARALATLGWTLRRGGDRLGAREQLRTALDMAARLGAVTLADFARDELVATGLRPRRAAITGPDALTPRQRRVAELAANGRTYQAIAQELFISVKTVETHLGSVYRKLDVTSKAELAAALAGG